MADEDVESPREILGRAVQAAVHAEAEIEDNYVVGWVLVAESVSGDGGRWLSKLSGDANGDVLPSWTERGLCGEVVQNWPEAAPAEDEED